MRGGEGCMGSTGGGGNREWGHRVMPTVSYYNYYGAAGRRT